MHNCCASIQQTVPSILHPLIYHWFNSINRFNSQICICYVDCDVFRYCTDSVFDNFWSNFHLYGGEFLRLPQMVLLFKFRLGQRHCKYFHRMHYARKWGSRPMAWCSCWCLYDFAFSLVASHYNFVFQRRAHFCGQIFIRNFEFKSQ